MLAWALVFVGGGVGSVLRHAIAVGTHRLAGPGEAGRFPLGTLAVNLIGCAAIGAAAGWCAQREPARALIVVGLLGGFTTFSSFGLDTIRLLEAGAHGKAVLYVLLSTAAGIGAVWLTYEAGYAVEPGALDPN